MSQGDSFDTSFEARQAAAAAYVNGDGAPLAERCQANAAAAANGMRRLLADGVLSANERTLVMPQG